MHERDMGKVRRGGERERGKEKEIQGSPLTVTPVTVTQ